MAPCLGPSARRLTASHAPRLPHALPPLQKEELLRLLRGPFTNTRALKTLSQHYMDLAIVTAAGPYLTPDGKPATALPTPFLSRERMGEVVMQLHSTSDRAVQAEVQRRSREQLAELQKQQREQMLAVVREAERKCPKLAARGCSKAAEQLRIPVSTVQGRGPPLQGHTIAALLVCIKGCQALATACKLCGVHPAHGVATMAAQEELVQQLLAMPGSVSVQAAEEAAAARRAHRLLADIQALLDQRAPPEVAERFAAIKPPDWWYTDFTGQRGKQSSAANVAAFVLAKADFRLSLAAATRLLPDATVSGTKYCSKPSSRVYWMGSQMLPMHPSPAAATLRQHGAVAAAVAAAHPEDVQGAVIEWVEEAVETACGVLPSLVRSRKVSQAAAEDVVAALATLPVDGGFTSFQGSAGSSKRVQPRTYAAAVLHLRAAKVAGQAAGVAFGLSHAAVREKLNPKQGGQLVWLEAAVRGHDPQAARQQAQTAEEEGSSRGQPRQRQQ